MTKTVKELVIIVAVAIAGAFMVAAGSLFGQSVVAPAMQCPEEDSYNCVYHDDSGSFVVVGTEDLNIRIPW